MSLCHRSPPGRDASPRRPFAVLALVLALAAPLQAATVGDLAADDPRNIRTGLPIPAQNYCDQPYVVVASNGEWVVVLTTGTGEEGSPGQHVVSARSADQGQTWSALADIEPSSGPEASWAVPLLTPYGRIYAFYTFNGDTVSNLPGSTARIRTDMLGWYCFKYSDDNGRTWSAQRTRIPLPVTACDRTNQWGGAVQIFWGIDKPKVQNGVVRFGFTKLGRYMLDQGEGWVVTSDNLLTERDPAQLRFAIRPDGDRGIRNPAFGSVQEEHNLVPLDGDDLFCAYRLNELTPAQSVSRDGGRTWSLPARMTYGPGQRTLKQPRACPKLFKTADGRFLFWFHNHSGKSFESRNPVFLSGGLLHADGVIRWSEPEVVLFDPAVGTRMSYPDLIEQDGRVWLTETQKTVARVHALDPSLVHGLWGQATNRTVCAEGLLPTAGADAFGRLEGRGLSVEMLFTLDSDAPGQTLFRKTDAAGKGVSVATALAADGSPALAITLSDGTRSVMWDTDPGLIRKGWTHHVVFLCDFSARLIGVVLDGRYADGALRRQYGWGRIRADLEAIDVTDAASTAACVGACRLYSRALTTSQALGNYRSFRLSAPPEDESAPRTVACWPLDAQGGTPALASAVNAAYTFTPQRHAPAATNAQAVARVPMPDATPGFVGDPHANAGAILFDASRPGYLVASNLGARVEHTVAFTVEGWLCRTADPGADLWYVCGAREIGTGWMLSLRRNDSNIGYHLHVNGLGIDATFPGGDVTQNPGWQHLALVYDPGRNALGAWELFLNGVSAGVLDNTQAPNTHGIAAFNLGGRAFSAANTYRGLFDFWRVSSGARTPATFLCAPPSNGTQMRVLLKTTTSQTKDSHG
jgi:hypothetical protein